MLAAPFCREDVAMLVRPIVCFAIAVTACVGATSAAAADATVAEAVAHLRANESKASTLKLQQTEYITDYGAGGAEKPVQRTYDIQESGESYRVHIEYPGLPFPPPPIPA